VVKKWLRQSLLAVMNMKQVVGVAIDPRHAQEAQQTCWVEKDK